MFHMQLHPGNAGLAIEYAHKSLIACGGAPPILVLLDIPFANWTNAQRALCHTVQTGYIGMDFDLLGPDIDNLPNPQGQPDLQDLPLDQWNHDHFVAAQAARILLWGGPGVFGTLEDCYNDFQPGTIGLVRGGATPVALVRIAGPYEFVPHPPDDWSWFRHRWPVEILGWYAVDSVRFGIHLNPPPPGWCGQLVNEHGALYQGLCEWYSLIQREAVMTELLQLIDTQRNVILQGPPGTSKTWCAKRLAARILFPDRAVNAIEALVNQYETDGAGEFADAGWDIVQFHPAYNYEDFVRGIQVSTEKQNGLPPIVRYDTVHRIFSEMCQRAGRPANSEKKFVLIIDEINRANLAAVLGELIYALEYRGEPVRTPYKVKGGGYGITVPRNLYIIGTMNTADRSIGHIDYAVRRRFAFVPMLPSRVTVERHYAQHPELWAVAHHLFDAVDGLFAPGEGCRLSREFYRDDVQPGHTYFLVDTAGGEAPACRGLILKFVYQVVPLLREYVKDGVLTGNLADWTVGGVAIPLSAPVDPASTNDLMVAFCPNAIVAPQGA